MSVHFDERRGHIRVDSPTGTATFVESGNTLSLWVSTTTDLDPETALELANALRSWTQRRAAIRRQRCQ